MKRVYWFKELSKENVSIAGGKGASLGEMTKAGIPVPNGFVVSRDAFDRFLEETGLNVKIHACLGKVNIAEMHTIENASEEIHAMILEEEMPADLKKEILKCFKELDSKFVAVRSSATSEDSSTAAWAGQLESYLNTTDKTLLENVKKCWASLFTPRAIFYRFEKQLHKIDVSVAVVVQKMVNSEEAGIAFSVHPVTQDKNQMIIEAGFGLGEAVVSGQVTPDSYVVEKKELKIAEKVISEQDRGLFRNPKGGNDWNNLGEKGKSQVLADREIIELSKIVINIENHYSFPVDVEWAKEKGRFYIVQSRPITTLTDNLPSQENKWGFRNINDYGFIGRWTQPLIEIAAWIQWQKQPKTLEFNFDKAGITDDVIVNCNFLRTKDGLMKEIIERVYDELKLNSLKLTDSFFGYLDDIHKRIDALLKEYEGRYDSKEFFIKSNELHAELRFPWWNNFSMGRAVDKYLQEYCKKHNIELDRITSLIPVLENDVSDDEDMLRKFKSEFKKHSIAGNADMSYISKKSKKLATSLVDYQKKTEYMGTHHWWGDPRDISKLIDEIKKIGPKSEHKKHKVPKELQLAFLVAAEATQKRLNSAMVAARLEYSLRKPLTELAKKNGLEYGDIIYCTPEEISRMIEGGKKASLSLINERKKGFSMFYIEGNLKIISGKENEEIYKYFSDLTETKDFKDRLHGQIGCRGIVQGNACILLTPKDIPKLGEGMVLVATETTPEYIPAMKKAIAFVTEIGGVTSHAAIIAREFNKPCIIGAKNATQVLKDGDLIEVNANKGVVKILKKRGLETDFLDEVKKMKWTRWLERPFFAFLISCFEDSVKKETLAKIKVKNFEIDTMLFQKGSWYWNERLFDKMDNQLEIYLAKHSIFEVTSNLKKFHDKSIAKIKMLIKSKSSIEERFAEFFDIANQSTSFIWLTHGIEIYYNKKLKQEVPKYVKKDVDKFIGDASLPSKKNAHAKMEEMMRKGVPSKVIAVKYGWIRARDGFTEPFSAEDIDKQRKNLPKQQKHEKVKVPIQLKKLFSEAQELVFFRTARTDVFYEIMFKAKPLIKEMAKKHKIPFNEMKYYRAKSFIFGNAEKYSPNFAFVYHKGNVLFSNEPITEEEKIESKDSIKGTIAYKGKVSGIVKIVTDVSQLDKVKKGDIMVSQMTFPSFISAMNRAAAFVTDEGGITCHAAIVAREMKKPCIIGTKVATRILKDGDIVEVDADNGIVRIVEEDSQNLMEELLKKDKIMQRAPAYPIFVLSFGATFMQLDPYLDYTYKGIVLKFYGDHADFAYLKEDFPKILDSINRKIWENPHFLQDVKSEYLRQLNEKIEEYNKNKKDKLNDEEILNQFFLACRVQQYTVGIAHLIEPFSIVQTHKLKDMIAKQVKDPAELGRVLNIMTSLEEKSFARKYDDALFRASREKNKKKKEKLIKDICNKYHWIKNSYAGSDELTAKDVKEQLKTAKEPDSNYFKNLKKEKLDAIKKYKLSRETLELADKLLFISIWQDERKENILKALFELDSLLHLISSRFSVKYEDLRLMMEHEITGRKFLDNNFKEEIERRRKSFMWFFGRKFKDKYYWTSGDEAEKLFKKFKKDEEVEGDTINGTCASTGNAIGKVSICLTIKDIKNFKKGDVLVTGMTRPEFVPAMKLAAAVVTDEGGITSHAAIVARELKIPCVIGTKNATQVLKNGELVEVKADHGAVRLIKRATKRENPAL